jgi:uncharacterized protein (UPF0332 family)
MELVGYWQTKSEECLESAASELDAGRLAFAVNRLYYAMFYMVTAALAINGRQLGKHSAVRSTFHMDFVKTGTIDKSFGRLYDELFHARHQGDYLPLADFEDSVVRQQLEDVKNFFGLFKAIIKKMISE